MRFACLLLATWGLTSTTWLVLWSVLAALTVLLVVLLRTRWSRAKPWRKCAVLSLWVHVLLGCVATTVRIVTGAPETGSDEPIRVAVREVVVAEESEVVEEVTPAWEQPTEPAMIAPEAEPVGAPIEQLPEELEPLPEPEPSEPAPPLEAPELLESPAAEVETFPEPAESPPEQSQLAEPTATEPAAQTPTEANAELPAETPAPILADNPVEDTPLPAETTAPTSKSPPTPALPSTYADRFAKDREALVQQRGGSEQTEQAVRAALGWLAAAQSKNGGWDASRFGAGAARRVLDQDRRGAGAQADMGVTGLALLAFLGGGHSHLSGTYTYEVAGGLEYLRQRQRADGALYGDAQLFAQMYCHSMATFAVCEALALTGDERLEPMARAAIRYTLSMQHPTDGGWRYRYGHKGDTSQLGWQLMSLKSAQLAGLRIPPTTWTLVDRFLRRVERGRAGGLACYQPGSHTSRTMTAEALFCRQLQQAQQQGNLPTAAIEEAVNSISAELPSVSRRNLYFWYYATLALHQNQHESAAAATAWENWNHALTTTLLTTQQGDGSWDVHTVWGGCGGQVYTTALSTLCLEVYYRYSPTEPPSQVADREGWQGVRR